MGDHWAAPVSRLVTRAQSPAAYTSGRLVRSWPSTGMVPLTISRPLPSRKAVLGRMPALTTTTSAGRVPASVFTAVTRPSPRMTWAAVPVITRMPAACSFLRAKPAISSSSTPGMIWPATSSTVTFSP